MGIGTQALLKARIALELARPDILSTDVRIADAITDAITMYQKERFRFSDINPALPPTFNTVANQFVYDVGAMNEIASSFYLDWLIYTQGTSNFTVTRVTPLEIVMANQNNIKGPPEMFAYEGESLMISPIPDQAYAMTLDCHVLVAAPAADATAGNRWMIDGEMLIRSRVKFEIFTHVTRNAAMAQAMSPDANGGPGGGPGATYRAWRAMKGEANRLKGRGRVMPMAW
jgi:hypothetical protein